MRSLYLRIWLTVVVALALFALVSGWLLQRHLEAQRTAAEAAVRERVEAWGELLEGALPPADAPVDEVLAALREWSQRMRLPMALDDAQGRRVAASDNYLRRERAPGFAARLQAVRFADGRVLWVAPFGQWRALRRGMAPPPDGADGAIAARDDPSARAELELPPLLRPPWPHGMRGYGDRIGLVALLAVLFAAVAAGAWPVVRRLTRRLEALKRGVEAFGAGALDQRVVEDGRDEVAAVAASFNRAAARIEALVRSHETLLANASHELRSPLARLKMAVAMLDDAPDEPRSEPTADPRAAPSVEPRAALTVEQRAALTVEQRAALRREIDTDIAELDALVEEVLLAGRLDAGAALERREPVELLALAAEEAARYGAVVEGHAVAVSGDERLLRRALRNLLENARRYGGASVDVHVARDAGDAELRVCDRGPGVPDAYRERIFEPFFRLPGHAEREGGVGLGLSLVRQIAERHGGRVRCDARAGGGSCFVLRLPAAVSAGASPTP